MTNETLKSLQEEADFVYGHQDDILKMIHHPQADEITSVSFSHKFVDIVYVCKNECDLYIHSISMKEYLDYKESLFALGTGIKYC